MWVDEQKPHADLLANTPNTMLWVAEVIGLNYA